MATIEVSPAAHEPDPHSAGAEAGYRRAIAALDALIAVETCPAVRLSLTDARDVILYDMGLWCGDGAKVGS